jgi:hypothetical protein
MYPFYVSAINGAAPSVLKFLINLFANNYKISNKNDRECDDNESIRTIRN